MLKVLVSHSNMSTFCYRTQTLQGYVDVLGHKSWDSSPNVQDSPNTTRNPNNFSLVRFLVKDSRVRST